MTLSPTDLRTRRERLGLSQRALAEALGLQQMTVWRWENGGAIEKPRMLELALDALETQAAPA